MLEFLLLIGSYIIAFLGVIIFLAGVTVMGGIIFIIFDPPQRTDVLLSISVEEEDEEDRAD